MHLHYDKQLEFKTDLLHQALKKFAPAGYENFEIKTNHWYAGTKSIIELNCNFKLESLKGQVKAGLYAQEFPLFEVRDCLVKTRKHKQLPIALLNS